MIQCTALRQLLDVKGYVYHCSSIKTKRYIDGGFEKFSVEAMVIKIHLLYTELAWMKALGSIRLCRHYYRAHVNAKVRATASDGLRYR